MYSPESLRAEYLRRTAPNAHREELAAGYISGLYEEPPAVITLNMRQFRGASGTQVTDATSNAKLAMPAGSVISPPAEYTLNLSGTVDRLLTTFTVPATELTG